MRIPRGVWKIIKEILRHLLRRPVVGISALCRDAEGRILLIRRGDTGEWALPGGTLEWGEDLRSAIVRELLEEAGVVDAVPGELLGVYSRPDRDPRFHAVTIVVGARIDAPTRAPDNPAEILEVKLFAPSELPTELSHGNRDMLEYGLGGSTHWE